MSTCYTKKKGIETVFTDSQMVPQGSHFGATLQKAQPIFLQHTMRNRDPHRENVENILAICLPIMAMQHIRESPSASHAMRKSAWNE